MIKTTEEKFKTVIEKNTFYFFNSSFEEKYEAHINTIRETLLVLKNEVEIRGLNRDIFNKLLAKNEYGLYALLTLTGFSNESFKRLITLIRVVDDIKLAELSFKDKWCLAEDIENIKEWSDDTIARKVVHDEYFRAGIVNLFFEGATIAFLANTIPLFELKKLSISKLQFDIPAMIDTLIRYKEKGSYSGKKENNSESIIKDILETYGLDSEAGDLSELITNSPDIKRTMDFIIPDKKTPRIIIESSFLVTTSSGQGDKSKTEISIRRLIKQHYPNAKFIGFVDGIGWYVRKGDLKRMVSAYEDVFTFHKDELKRFESLLKEEFEIK
ncbi:MAG: DpnII family type II restriction endonuclease [Dehalococcoidales bacterium]|nr:DpnII family type II restriction endonuclease [Dehalococcoidales bacterium]